MINIRTFRIWRFCNIFIASLRKYVEHMQKGSIISITLMTLRITPGKLKAEC